MKKWIQAARLRTLTLSVSGIIVGSFYAMRNGFFEWNIFLLAILTTLGLQILSNFANDYGDGIKGTDENRIGEKRAVQSGEISAKKMKNVVLLTTIFTLFLAILLIYVSFGKNNFGYSLLFFILGIVSIVAALKYTIGSKAYGYYGFGDIFVFMFFGLLSVSGSYFLYSKEMDLLLFLPASAIGLLSVGVLNLNNMRDEQTDKISGKNTIVVKIGGKKAKTYHFILIVSAFVGMLVFAFLKKFNLYQYLLLLGFTPLLFHLKRVYNNNNLKDYDPELKVIGISTLLISALFSIVMNVF